MNLTKDAIFSLKDDLGLKAVEVPEWGGTIYLRGLRGIERDAFETSMWDGEGKDKKQNLANLRARLLVRSISDENGVRVFGDDDAAELGLRSGKVLDRLYDIAAALSGIGPQAVEAATKN